MKKNATSIEELIAGKPLPKWLSSNSVFKSIDKIEKVFPSIGLINQSEPSDIVGNFAADYAMTLLNAAKSELCQAFDALEAFDDKSLVAIRFRNERMALMSIISQIDDALVDNISAFITSRRDKIELELPVAISADAENIASFEKGYPFFDFYNQIGFYLSNYFAIRIRAADKLASHKDFNASNFTVKNASIVFSSDGKEGLWDILTMSMRGIKSCVRWDGAHKLTLIGSMADPYTAIIYLTSTKKEKLGTHMAKRCLVRFVIDSETEKPYLLIDRMYPVLDVPVLEAFRAFIEKKTGSKFEIIYGPTMDETRRLRSYIPNREITEKLNEKTFSYRDTKLPIGKRPSKISERRDTNLKIKLHNLIVRLKKETPIDQCLGTLNNPDYQAWIRSHKPNVVSDYGALLVNEAKTAIDIDKDMSSDECLKRICFYLLTNKKDVIRAADKKFMRDKQLSAILSKKEMQPMLDTITTSLSKTVKTYTRSIIDGSHKQIVKSKKTRKKAVVK